MRDVDRVVGLLGNRFKPQLIINRLRPQLVRKGKMLSVDDVNAHPAPAAARRDRRRARDHRHDQSRRAARAARADADRRRVSRDRGARRRRRRRRRRCPRPRRRRSLERLGSLFGGKRAMIEFLKRLFGHPGSSSTAKERLRLVLMTDHLELAPDMIDAMKRDLVDVISRYVEVDREQIDVTFERQDSTLAMLANIPILSVNASRRQRREPTATGSPQRQRGARGRGAGARRRPRRRRPRPPPRRQSRRRAKRRRKNRRRRRALAPASTRTRNATFVTSTGRWPSRPCCDSRSASSASDRPACTTPDVRAASPRSRSSTCVLGVPVMIGAVVRGLSQLAALGAGALRRQPAAAALHPARRSQRARRAALDLARPARHVSAVGAGEARARHIAGGGALPRHATTNLQDLWKPLLTVAIPALLILKQPDLGTALVLLAILTVAALLRACRNSATSRIYALGVLVVAAVAIGTNAVLKPFQKARLFVFLNPQARSAGRRATTSTSRRSPSAAASGSDAASITARRRS